MADSPSFLPDRQTAEKSPTVFLFSAAGAAGAATAAAAAALLQPLSEDCGSLEPAEVTPTRLGRFIPGH